MSICLVSYLRDRSRPSTHLGDERADAGDPQPIDPASGRTRSIYSRAALELDSPWARERRLIAGKALAPDSSRRARLPRIGEDRRRRHRERLRQVEVEADGEIREMGDELFRVRRGRRRRLLRARRAARDNERESQQEEATSGLEPLYEALQASA